MSEWKAFKDEYPTQKADFYGRMQTILKEVNTTFFTHWMEIPEVPDEID